MSTRINLAIQLAALFTFAVFRLAAPGWILLMVVFSVVGAVVLLLPTILAVATLSRRRLPAPAAVPFLGCAGSLVVAGALVPDCTDTEDYMPLLRILNLDGDPYGPPAGIGAVAVVVFIICAALTPVAVAVTTTRDARTPPLAPPATPPRAWRAAAAR
jgi:hypothetical protein